MASKKGMPLVVVESPTKAKTLKGMLPEGYRVAASMGHVRDLPEKASEIPEAYRSREWARLGVDVHSDFQPLYVVPAEKKKVVAELRSLLKGASSLILATDEDREGESIGWHLLQLLNPKVPVSRIVFHEITPEAIEGALRSPRQVDERLVRAQETRRILDRLVGYTVSPLLWKKIAKGLSAGRVQSVAVRLLVQRERERRAFRSGSYWDLKAQLSREGEAFPAKLMSLGGIRVASGRDFDEATGRLIEGRSVVLLGEEDATALRVRLERSTWEVTETDEKPTLRRPAPPFTTSTLQQEANRKLGLSARDAMRIAQRLYEEGLITYMRTDSVHLSEQAIGAARGRVRKLYGEEYLSEKPRQFTTRTKGAQEAHEAIRPAGTEMRTVDELRLTGREAALYELIWKRTVASQMAEARVTQISALIAAGGDTGERAVFRASGRRIDFAGFFRAYVEGSDDPEAALEDREELLPRLTVGDELGLLGVEALGHETQPPARFTEASLVKTLESEGIGRPSTYASIIGTIIDRGYVNRQGNQLVPTFTAFAVTGLLEEHFPTLVDTRFTARMEQELDGIAEGEADWIPYLREFFLGEGGLERLVSEGSARIDPREASTVRLEGLAATVRVGRYGPFVEVQEGDQTVTASVPEGVAPADLSSEDVQRLVRVKTEGPDVVGQHPDSGQPIFLLSGRFGPYVQLGEVAEGEKPRRASLPKGIRPEDMTLEVAVRLLSLPRVLGSHPETGREIQAGVGRFGPFVVHEKDFRSLTPADDVYSVDLGRALELLAEPKAGRRKGAEPIRVLGEHPVDGEPVGLFAGRYGPYVRHGPINASIPRDADPDAFSLEEAIRLLNGKEPPKKKAAPKAAGKGRGKKAAGGAKGVTAKKPGGGRKAAGGAGSVTRAGSDAEGEAPSATASRSKKGAAAGTGSKKKARPPAGKAAAGGGRGGNK